MHNKEVDILNRDFKFRLYDKVSKHYYDNDSFLIGRCEILAAPKGDKPFDYEVLSGLSSGRFSLEQFIERYDKNGKEILPKEWELDTLITEGDEALENKSGLRRDIPELNLIPYDDSIKEEMKNVWMTIGLAYTTVGLEANSANQSGVSLEIKERSTVIVRNNKIKLWDKFLKDTYRLLLIFDQLNTASVSTQDDGVQVYKIDTIHDNLDINIEFPVYNNQTFEERIDTATKALGVVFDYGASIEYALRNRYTEDEMKEILINMKIENGIPAIGNQLENTVPVDTE